MKTSSKLVVGIHCTGPTSSVAIVQNGKLLFGAAEERFTRQKFDKSFPMKALRKGLDYVGAEARDVTDWAIGWNPALNIAFRYRAGFSEWPAHPGYRFSSVPNHILPLLHDGVDGMAYTETEQIFHPRKGQSQHIHYVTHHLAHAAMAYYTSGWDRANILTVDGYGEHSTIVWAKGEGLNITQEREVRFPHSLGMLWATVTQWLGFTPEQDEWKVMGMAAYGNPQTFFYEHLRRVCNWDADGGFQLELAAFQFNNFDAAPMWEFPWIEAMGCRRRPGETITQEHYDLAFALQWLTQEYLLSVAEPPICFGGGCAMNCVANGLLSDKLGWDQVHVPFAPDDTGNAIGAALYVTAKEGIPIDVASCQPYLGPEYCNDQVLQATKNLKKNVTRHESIASLCKQAAHFLAEGKIVGWYQGRMEFGQRALGNRSILADPRNPDMKDRINQAVKFREHFRPFAPVVRLEDAPFWFKVPFNVEAQWMERTAQVQESLRDQIPAVVHADGSARLQTVTEAQNPRLYQMLTEFHKLTGVPVLLNTSFNLVGEPIVESPQDAIRTFVTSGMDYLVMGDCIIWK